MKVGLMPLFGGSTSEPEYVARLAKGMEDRGFHSAWLPDHIVLPTKIDSAYPYRDDGSFPVDPTIQGLEPFTLIAFMAAHTKSLRLGTGVCVLPQRNPALVAKQATDADVLSGGRLDFGIGVGWLAEEFEAMGESFARRGARSDDYIKVMKALWENDVSSYEGEFYTLAECYQYPKPTQKPHMPLYFGGESKAALRRVARYGHWYGVDVLPEDVPEKMVMLKEMCDREGRDINDVNVILCPYDKPCDADTLRRYEDAGVDQVVMAAFVPGQDEMEAAIDQIAEALIVPAKAAE
jgi:probable F420-dependent oxidoreductase